MRPRRHRALVTAIVVALLVGTAAVVASVRYVAPLPAATITYATPTSTQLGGRAATLPPALSIGSLAVWDSVAGDTTAEEAAVARPIASIAKTMTALVVLTAKPLAVGAPGPTYVISDADVAILHEVVAEGGSYVPVVAGEVLTERQLLLGLMLPSANNFAILLGRWVAGTDASFVDLLNKHAAQLGMSHTHFADADGLDARTVATTSDLLVLGRAAVAQPTLSEIISHASATLPDSTEITNIDTLVGTVPGWLGIKTGHTDAGGYCLLFAVRRTLRPGTAPVTIVGAVLAQTTRQATFDVARAAVAADLSNLVVVDPATLRPLATGSITTAWGASTGVAVALAATSPIVVPRGMQTTFAVDTLAITVPIDKNDHVGDVAVLVNGIPAARWPLVTTGALAGPPWWWRIRR